MHRDPDAMDVNQGRVRLAGAEDILHNDKYWEDLRHCQKDEDWRLGITDTPMPPFKPHEGYHKRQQDMQKGGMAKVKCFTCQQMGHISCYCPQKCKEQTMNVKASLSNPEREETPLEQADTWLRAVGGESDEVKNLILQTMWKDEDFPDA